MNKLLLADLNSSKILVYALFCSQIIPNGRAELQKVAIVDTATFGWIILLFVFLLGLHHSFLVGTSNGFIGGNAGTEV